MPDEFETPNAAEPVPIAYATRERTIAAPSRFDTAVATTAWACSAAALLLILTWSVESVMFTGPLVFLTGSVLIVRSAGRGDRGRVYLGAAHCLTCAVMFCLAFYLHWSPSDARVPFAWMAAAHTAGTGLWAALWSGRAAKRTT